MKSEGAYGDGMGDTFQPVPMELSQSSMQHTALAVVPPDTFYPLVLPSVPKRKHGEMQDDATGCLPPAPVTYISDPAGKVSSSTCAEQVRDGNPHYYIDNEPMFLCAMCHYYWTVRPNPLNVKGEICNECMNKIFKLLL